MSLGSLSSSAVASLLNIVSESSALSSALNLDTSSIVSKTRNNPAYLGVGVSSILSKTNILSGGALANPLTELLGSEGSPPGAVAAESQINGLVSRFQGLFNLGSLFSPVAQAVAAPVAEPPAKPSELTVKGELPSHMQQLLDNIVLSDTSQNNVAGMNQLHHMAKNEGRHVQKTAEGLSHLVKWRELNQGVENLNQYSTMALYNPQLLYKINVYSAQIEAQIETVKSQFDALDEDSKNQSMMVFNLARSKKASLTIKQLLNQRLYLAEGSMEAVQLDARITELNEEQASLEGFYTSMKSTLSQRAIETPNPSQKQITTAEKQLGRQATGQLSNINTLNDQLDQLVEYSATLTAESYTSKMVDAYVTALTKSRDDAQAKFDALPQVVKEYAEIPLALNKLEHNKSLIQYLKFSKVFLSPESSGGKALAEQMSNLEAQQLELTAKLDASGFEY